MSSKEPRRHHVVPQVLLRYFADTGFIRVAPINGDPTRLENIRNVSVVNHANTVDTDYGRDFSIEKSLSGFEGKIPDIVLSLAQSTRTQAEDALVRGLIAMQIGRDPLLRTGFLGDDLRLTYESLEYSLRESNPHITDASIEEELDFYARQYVVRSHVRPTPENIAIAGTAALINAWYADIANGHLTVLRAQDGQFITADSAVSIFPNYDKALYSDEAAFKHVSELLLPITPQYAALMTTRLSRQTINVGRDVVAIVNARTARSAGRNVYAAPSYPEDQLRSDMTGWWAPRQLMETLAVT